MTVTEGGEYEMREWMVLLRTALDLTQEALAIDVGVHRTYITKIEKGESDPSPTVAKKIAKKLGCEWTLFFENKCDCISHLCDEKAHSIA